MRWPGVMEAEEADMDAIQADNLSKDLIKRLKTLSPLVLAKEAT